MPWYKVALVWTAPLLLAAASGISAQRILTAAASSASVGQTNTEGVSQAMAKADHGHAHAIGTPTASPNAGNTNSSGASGNFADAAHVHACTSASASQVGCVDTGAQTWAGAKTFSSAGPLTVNGAGQATSNFNTTGALGGSAILGDSGGGVDNGGALIFSANNSAWLFAAIKGGVRDGSGNTKGNIYFQVRPSTASVTMTTAGYFQYDGQFITNYAAPGGLTQEGWTNIGSFTNSWVNYLGPSPPTSYMKDSEGFVHIRGALKSGTINAVGFQLPAGYRPAYIMSFMGLSYSGAAGGSGLICPIVIDTSGNVTIGNDINGSNYFVSIDGITFDTR